MVLLNIFMQSYQTIKDMKLRDSWLKANGYNPSTFFNPNLEANFIRAQATAKQLLAQHRHLLLKEHIRLLEVFNRKSTQRHIYQVLNLSKKISRQLHRQK